MKKSLTSLLGAALVVSLAGCTTAQPAGTSAAANEVSTAAPAGTAQSTDGAAPKTDGEKKKVTFYVWAGGAEQEFDKAIVAQYEKEHPDVDIEDNYIPYGEYLSKINTLAAAGNMPDIFNLPEGNVFEWGEKGVLLDLRTLYDQEGIKPEEEMIESVIFADDEHLWSVGYNATTISLLYNKELLAANGITPPSTDAANPWTWDEFVENARKMTKDINGRTPFDEDFDEDNVMVYGTMMPTDWTKFEALLYTNNSRIASADGLTSMIDQEKGIEVIQAIADLSLVEKCAPNIGTAKGAFADASAMLMNGQLGMVIDGGWALSNYTNEGFDVGVAQIPMFETPANMSWTAGLCMAPGAADNAAAFDFYKYFTDFKNSIRTANDYGVSLGGLPHTLDVFDGGANEKEWIDTYQKVDAAKMCEAYKNILTHENTIIAEGVTLKNFSIIVDNTVVPALDNVWLGESSAKDALEALNLTSLLQGSWK